MLTIEDKLKITARNFLNDNPDDYKDYHEALTEFMGKNRPSDSFIEVCVGPYLKPEDGVTLFTKDGFVIGFKDDDGFVQYRTDFSENEAEKLQSESQAIADENEDMSGVDIFKQLGWKLIEQMN